MVRSLDRLGRRSGLSNIVEATPLPEIKEPVFVALFEEKPVGELLDGKTVPGKLHGGAKTADGKLDLGSVGHATFGHLPEFDLTRAISVECRVYIDKAAQMPVILSCGGFQQSGWFLQSYGGRWRWHLGGVSCDGGSPATGRWIHLAATFNGRRACLYQDGKQVAAVDCSPNRAAYPGPLTVGQYSVPAMSYQVTGQIADVKVYRRALRAEEIAETFEARKGR